MSLYFLDYKKNIACFGWCGQILTVMPASKFPHISQVETSNSNNPAGSANLTITSYANPVPLVIRIAHH